MNLSSYKNLGVVLIVFIALSGGCGTNKPNLNDELAGRLGMKPFGLNGGYDLGTVVILGEDGLPQILAGNSILVGAPRTVSPKKSIAAMTFDRKDAVLASIAASSMIKSDAELNSSLRAIESFSLHIEKWTNEMIEEGPIVFEKWLSGNIEGQFKNQRDETIRALENISDGQDIYFITEIVEVQKGSYKGKWRNALSASAKADFGALFTSTGTVSWDSDRDMSVVISENTPLRVAYKARPWRAKRLKEIARGTALSSVTPSAIPSPQAEMKPPQAECSAQSTAGLARKPRAFVPTWRSLLGQLKQENDETDLTTLVKRGSHIRHTSGEYAQPENLIREALFTVTCLEKEGELKLETLGPSMYENAVPYENQRIVFRDR